MTAPLVSVRDLRVQHRTAGFFGPARVTTAVDGVSFDVMRGETLALVGESGCGKTTTAQAAMRMVPATAGAIRFRGRDITGASQRDMRPIRREMQLIFQDPYESLDPRFRVRQIVAEPLEIHGLDNRDERVRDRKSTRLNSSHSQQSRMPSSA